MGYNHELNLYKKSLRSIHFMNQLGFCAYCNCKMNQKKKRRDDFSVTLEHIVPRMHGGSDSLLNTVAVCYRCNQTRGALPLSFEMMKGIFVHKGFDALIPIGSNWLIYIKHRLCVFTRHLQMISISVFA